MNDINFKNMPRQLKFILICGLIFFAGTIIFYFINFRSGLSVKNDEWGQFGDYLGGVLNPTFAFLTFIALLYTIIMQRDELNIVLKWRKVEEIVLVMKLISEQIDGSINNYVNNSMLTKEKNSITRSHPILFDIEKAFISIYVYLRELESINKDSIILIYYQRKYKGNVFTLCNRGYLNDDIKKFFS